MVINSYYRSLVCYNIIMMTKLLSSFSSQKILNWPELPIPHVCLSLFLNDFIYKASEDNSSISVVFWQNNKTNLLAFIGFKGTIISVVTVMANDCWQNLRLHVHQHCLNFYFCGITKDEICWHKCLLPSVKYLVPLLWPGMV